MSVRAIILKIAITWRDSNYICWINLVSESVTVYSLKNYLFCFKKLYSLQNAEADEYDIFQSCSIWFNLDDWNKDYL